MIIKTGVISSGDGSRVCNYVVAQKHNEQIDVLTDSNAELLVSDQFAELRGRKNGLLHIIVSPDRQLANDQLTQTIAAVRAEFGYNPKDPETIVMHESRRSDGSLQQHYHLVRPATDTETGKTYKLFRSKAKDEAVSRRMELELGHSLTPGVNNKFAEMRLREMGKNNLADRLAKLVRERPRAAFNAIDHQQAKRKNCNLPKLRHQLTLIAALPRSDQPAKLAEMIDSQGLELRKAITRGRGRSRIILAIGEGVRDHNANRTLKIPAAQVNRFIAETREHLNGLTSDITEHRRDFEGAAENDHQRSGADTPIEHSFDSAHERTFEDTSSCCQGLSDERKLADAANELRSQAMAFSDNRVADSTSAVIDAPLDPKDPNLLRKLSMILKRQLDSANATQKKAMLSGAEPRM